MEIPIIIPVKNGLHLTRNCVRTLKKQDVPVFVWILDNGSTDGTREWGQSEDSVWYTQGNGHSVARSWNTCLTHAFSLGHPLCCVFNNDTEFPPHFVRLLVEDGGPFVTGVGVNDRSCLKREPHPESKSPHPDFAAYLIRRECWEKVGPFDEDFKGAYFEDNAYHVECHRKGIHAYSIDVPFYHVGSSVLKQADEAEAATIRANYDRNKELFRKKYGCVPGEPAYDALFTALAAG